MINLGTLMEKPGESAYAIYRRFLIANQSVSFTDLCHQVRIELQKLDLRFGKQILQKMVRKLVALRRGVELPEEPITITRNCPICAGIGYHSQAFERPWVSHCPTHKKEIVAHCPACRRAWPQAKDLFTRECNWCGRQISPCLLVDRGLFLKPPYHFYDIEFLSNLRVQDGFYISSECHIGFSNDRKTIRHNLSKNDPFFPTFYASIRKENCEKLTLAGAQLLPKREIEISLITDHNTSHINSHSENPQWKLSIQRRVLRQIDLSIKKHVGENHKLKFLEKDSAEYGEILCPYCFAATIWFHRVSNDDLLTTPNEIFGWRIYQARVMRQMPPTPKTMSKFASTSSPSWNIKLSEGIRKTLYFLDLWSLFINILKYVIAYNEAHLNNEKWIDLVNNLPPDSLPGNFLSDSIGFYWHSIAKLTVVIPQNIYPSKYPLPKTTQWEKAKHSSLESDAFSNRVLAYWKDPAFATHTMMQTASPVHQFQNNASAIA